MNKVQEIQNKVYDQKERLEAVQDGTSPDFKKKSKVIIDECKDLVDDYNLLMDQYNKKLSSFSDRSYKDKVQINVWNRIIDLKGEQFKISYKSQKELDAETQKIQDKHFEENKGKIKEEKQDQKVTEPEEKVAEVPKVAPVAPVPPVAAPPVAPKQNLFNPKMKSQISSGEINNNSPFGQNQLKKSDVGKKNDLDDEAKVQMPNLKPVVNNNNNSNPQEDKLKTSEVEKEKNEQLLKTNPPIQEVVPTIQQNIVTPPLPPPTPIPAQPPAPTPVQPPAPAQLVPAPTVPITAPNVEQRQPLVESKLPKEQPNQIEPPAPPIQAPVQPPAPPIQAPVQPPVIELSSPPIITATPVVAVIQVAPPLPPQPSDTNNATIHVAQNTVQPPLIPTSAPITQAQNTQLEQEQEEDQHETGSKCSVRTERVVPEEEELQKLPKPPKIPDPVITQRAENDNEDTYSTKTQSKKIDRHDSSEKVVEITENPQAEEPRAAVEQPLAQQQNLSDSPSPSQKTRDKRPESVKTRSKKAENGDSKQNLDHDLTSDRGSEILENMPDDEDDYLNIQISGVQSITEQNGLVKEGAPQQSLTQSNNSCKVIKENKPSKKVTRQIDMPNLTSSSKDKKNMKVPHSEKLISSIAPSKKKKLKSREMESPSSGHQNSDSDVEDKQKNKKKSINSNEIIENNIENGDMFTSLAGTNSSISRVPRPIRNDQILDENGDVDTEKNSVNTYIKFNEGTDELESKKSRKSKRGVDSDSEADSHKNLSSSRSNDALKKKNKDKQMTNKKKRVKKVKKLKKSHSSDSEDSESENEKRDESAEIRRLESEIKKEKLRQMKAELARLKKGKDSTKIKEKEKKIKKSKIIERRPTSSESESYNGSNDNNGDTVYGEFRLQEKDQSYPKKVESQKKQNPKKQNGGSKHQTAITRYALTSRDKAPASKPTTNRQERVIQTNRNEYTKKDVKEKKTTLFSRKIVVQYHTTLLDEYGNEIDTKIEEEVIQDATKIKKLANEGFAGNLKPEKQKRRKMDAKKIANKPKIQAKETILTNRTIRNSSPAKKFTDYDDYKNHQSLSSQKPQARSRSTERESKDQNKFDDNSTRYHQLLNQMYGGMGLYKTHAYGPRSTSRERNQSREKIRTVQFVQPKWHSTQKISETDRSSARETYAMAKGVIHKQKYRNEYGSIAEYEDLQKLAEVEEELNIIREQPEFRNMSVSEYKEILEMERNMIRNLNLYDVDYLDSKQLLRMKKLTSHFNHIIEMRKKSRQGGNFRNQGRTERQSNINSRTRSISRSRSSGSHDSTSSLTDLKERYIELKHTYYEALRLGHRMNRQTDLIKYNSRVGGEYNKNLRDYEYVTPNSGYYDQGRNDKEVPNRKKQSNEYAYHSQTDTNRSNSRQRSIDYNHYYPMDPPEAKFGKGKEIVKKSQRYLGNNEYIEVYEYDMTEKEKHRRRPMDDKIDDELGYQSKYLKMKNMGRRY